ncbi:hypothetical protein HFP66_30370 [Bacillus sp. A17A.1]
MVKRTIIGFMVLGITTGAGIDLALAETVHLPQKIQYKEQVNLAQSTNIQYITIAGEKYLDQQHVPQTYSKGKLFITGEDGIYTIEQYEDGIFYTSKTVEIQGGIANIDMYIREGATQFKVVHEGSIINVFTIFPHTDS